MTTPHDDESRSELLNAPDHRPDFWTALDNDLAAEERENVVPLAAAESARPPGRGLFLVAAVLAVLGGIGAYLAFGGDDDGPEVAVDPEPSVTTAPDPTMPPTTVGEAVPATGVQSLTATVELVSAVATNGTFSLAADEDGTVILRNDDAEYGYHAPSGATWSRAGDRSGSTIDPIDGRSVLEFRLWLDLADAVRYRGLGEPGERDGRPTIEATVELTDNESAGWNDRTVTATIDAETGFVLDAIATETDRGPVEELHLTDIVWSDQPADISGAVGVDSDWTVTEGLPAQPLPSGLDLLVPVGGELERVFTTEAPVMTGSEAGNPVSAGAYVVNVTTAPWRHSKVVVLAGSGSDWRDPLATEGWFAEFESVTPTTGYLSGTEGTLTASPPQRPRVWFDTGDELIVAIDGLVDPVTAERLWNLEPAAEDPPPEGPPAFLPDGLPPVAWVAGSTVRQIIQGEASEVEVEYEQLDALLAAYRLELGWVTARRIKGGPAAASAWIGAVDETWWEPESGAPRRLDTGDAHAVVLLDAFLDRDGEPAVIYGETPTSNDLDGSETSLWLQRFDQSRSEAIELGGFTGPEYGVDSASRGGGRIAVSAGADLGEVFSFVDLDGNEVEEPNNPVPVGHRYNEPPFYQNVALGPNGRTLAFIEGPDWDRTTETTVGDWELVVVDLDTGDETARITLFEQGTIEVTHLDFDGTWAIVSRDDQTANQVIPLTALAVNTATGTMTELTGTSGTVTLHR